jgi:hypothetical protein
MTVNPHIGVDRRVVGIPATVPAPAVGRLTMHKRIVIDVDVHPAVTTVEKLVNWLAVIIPDLYAVRSVTITEEEVE